jgi:hypothetical protein
MLAQQDDDFDGEQIIEPPLLPGMGVAAAMPQPPGGAAAAAAAAAGGSSGSDASKQRGLPWWMLPQGLMSLCLSHMDLTGRGVTQCRAAGVQQQQQQEGCSSSDNSSGCSCCLAPAPAGSQQQRQQLLLPGLGLGLSLFQSTRPSPLRPLSKRRRQTQQRLGSGEVDVTELAGAAGGCSDDGSAAGCAAGAGAAAGDGDEGFAAALLSPPLCSCATVLPAHFSSLQALWFEHVSCLFAQMTPTATDCILAFITRFQFGPSSC